MRNNLKSILQNKQKIISRETGYPSQKAGRDGDFQVRRISGQGIFLFYKWGNKWYSSRLTQYRPKTAEHKQKVKIPIGVSPSTIGELSLDSTGNLAVKKGDNKLNHIISVDKDGLADSKQLQFIRNTTTGSVGSDMGIADAGEPEFLFQNTSGHAHLRLYSQSNVYDQFISFGRRHPDTFTTSVWCLGLDSSANEFRLMYDSVAGSAASTHGQIANVTPSSSSGEILHLDTTGNLTVGAGLYLGAALRIEPTSGDYFNIHVANSTGITTLSTVSDGATAPDLILDANGDIILDAVCGSGTGIELKNAGTLFGYFDIHHSATHLKLFENGGASTDDYFNIGVYANGATTLTTLDAAGAAAHLTLDADGSIIFDSHDGNFIAKKAGTEFSVANSAYAGMILGYRSIGEASAHASYTLTTSYAVPHADMNVSFKAPPSGNVKVFIQIYMNSSTSNKILFLGLSDNSTYNTIGAEYEHNAQGPDETDDAVIQHVWTITGLTAGTTYQYWLGAKTSGTNKFLNRGGNATGRYCDFIMEVTALPAATTDFAVYS